MEYDHRTDKESSKHKKKHKRHKSKHKYSPERDRSESKSSRVDPHRTHDRGRGYREDDSLGRTSRMTDEPTYHKSRKSDRPSSSSDSKLNDFDFNFENYRTSLNRIFFRDDEFLKRGSKEYNDFWAFLKKYQDFQRKRGSTSNGADDAVQRDNTLGLPAHYDKRYKINVAFRIKNVDVFLKKGRLVDYDVEEELTIERVKQFKYILLHYLDFLQKQKFNKLKKLRTDQENLPIFQFKQKIIDMIGENQVVVIAGDTGCGKSTQVPQYLMEAGFTCIACTQPRRIACISLAKRVGYETLNEYGLDVAYQVRFEKTKTRFTRILFLTEGLLLRQMSNDPQLSRYNIIVIDEVHERHIHTDFLLGLLKCLTKQREDLKIVLMSATINQHLFSQYFDDAPVIQVPGRLYPIEMQYCPIKLEELNAERLDPSPYLRVMQTIDHKYPETERGDLLIFLSGLSEILTVVEAAKAYAQNTKRWIILPLHGTLSIEEQDKVFDIAPEGVRKCIVSTNIAETSVTIDGVRFIVDSGKMKEKSYDPRFKMEKLQEFWISRASAEQRKGRAGRTGPGVCYRLYEESDFQAFQEYSTPEIQRVPLDSLVLQMIALGLPDARKFPFLEEPEKNSIENSIIFLKEQSALKEDETLTPIGQMLSRLPVDVSIGKMLIMGSIFHMIDPVLSIAAAMSVQSPFTSKALSDRDAMAYRKPLESDHGDPFTLLNAFDEWIQVKAEGQGTKKWCRKRALEEQRFYEMVKLKNQFKDLLKDYNLLNTNDDDSKKYLTSDERRKRHGERKRLTELKRERDRESKKRKVLKLEADDFMISDDEEDDKDRDIRDLEFRLSHDLDKLQSNSNKNRSFTLRDINLLKIILCSGLYPQVATADQCNNYKRDSEQAFHTKSKPFLLLHPTSVFMCKPEVLMPPEIKDPPRCPSDLQGKLSKKHQLLAYLFLLETTKPYLMNVMRVPALQTVTLFSNSIDTNADCTRLVCDGWLELRFADEESASQVISSIIHLRATWQNLLKLRLQDVFQSLDDDRRVNPRARKLEKVLASKLTEFLSSDVMYAVRRVYSAELWNMYKGPGSGIIEMESMKSLIKTPEETEAKEHPVKGGIQINDYMVYDCLLDDSSAAVWGEYTSHMQRHWQCPRCKQSLIVTVQERLLHESQCQDKNFQATKEEKAQEMEEEKSAQLNPLRKHYHCDKCDKDFKFTSTEILKHRKSHVDS